jgi:hypothetical protein
LLVAAAAAAPAPVARAQDKPPSATPAVFRLGTVPQTHVVQLSTELDWGDAATGDVECEAPPFVTILRQQPTRLVVLLQTNQLGPWNGAIRLRRGHRTLEIPVDATVLPRVPGATRVLIASGPFHAQSTTDDTQFEPWRKLVAVAKLQPHYVVGATDRHWLSVELLQRVDVVLLCEDGLLGASDYDIDLLQGFVCGGGRLVVCASAFYRGTVRKANELIDAFGLRMHDEEPRGTGIASARGEAVARDALTAKVELVQCSRPTPTALRDERAKALVTFDVFPDRPVVAVARTESGGEVVTLGVPLWWTWIGEGSDNARLLQNLLVRPRAAPR